MDTKIVSNCDLVLQGNSVSGFKLNSLISDSIEMKCLQDLSVPAGLFLINRSRIISDYADFMQKGDVIDDAVYDKLVSSAEYISSTTSSKKRRPSALASLRQKKHAENYNTLQLLWLNGETDKFGNLSLQ